MESRFYEARQGELVDLFAPAQRRATTAALEEGALYRLDADGAPVRIAAPGEALHRVLGQLRELALDPGHPAACYREARALIADDGLDDPRLQDLEALAFVTIDNPGSRDLDQALYLERGPAGLRLMYALADAAHYVRPGTALFAEALRRGVTYYAPGFAAPMLPPALSEGLVSLNPDVRRRALVFDIALDDDGTTCHATVYQARIRSRAKLSYAGVQAWLDARRAGQPHDWDGRDFAPSLALLPALGEQRMALARERNVVEHNRREAQTSLDPHDPGAFALVLRERNDVERYNEQVSLLCNMVGAQMLQRLAHHEDLQAIYRVHRPPLAQRLRELRRALDAVAELHGLDDGWRWDGRAPLADYLEALPAEPARLRRVIERQIMLTNRASQFSDEPGPHHALGVDGYARFSSPMREVAGIFTHKELLEAQGALAPQPRAADEQLREQVIAVANEAKRTQRKLEKSFQLIVVEQFLRDDLALPPAQRPLRAAVVMGMRGSRIYLAVEGFALDLKVYAADLERRWDCRYRVEDNRATPDTDAAPTLTIGDAVRLRTARWDESRARFVLDVEPPAG